MLGDELVGARLAQALIVDLERFGHTRVAHLLHQRFTQHLHDVAGQVFVQRRGAEGVHAQRLHGHAQLFQIVLDVAQELVEAGHELLFGPVQIRVDVHLHRLGHDQLAGVLFHQPLVHQLVLGDQIIDGREIIREAGGRERRRLMTHHHTTAATFDVHCFRHVVDDIGVDHRDVAYQQIRVVINPQAALLAGQPFLTAVGAEMDDGIGADLLAHPQVGGEITVVHRQQRVVVKHVVLFGRRIAARWLGQHVQIAVLGARNDEAFLAITFYYPVTVLRRAPAADDVVAHTGGQGGQPGFVTAERKEIPGAGLLNLHDALTAVIRAQHVGDRVDQLLVIHRVDVVAVFAQRRCKAGHGHRHVQVRRAHVVFAGRVVPEEQGQLLVGIGCAAQSGKIQRLLQQHVDVFFHRHVLAVFIGGDDHRVDQADVLGNDQVGGNAEIADAGGVLQVFLVGAVAVLHGIDGRNAQRLQPGLAAFRVAAQEGVDDDDVHEHLAIAHHQRVIRQVEGGDVQRVHEVLRDIGAVRVAVGGGAGSRAETLGGATRGAATT